MRIDKLQIKNFRGYEHLDVEFRSNFNLVIGGNGSGKTALLEALTIAMASYFLGIRNVHSKGITRGDVRIGNFEFSEEYQFPVEVFAEGVVNDQKLRWKRSLQGLRNRTTTTEARQIVEYAQILDKSTSIGSNSNLPLLAYYATGRLFDEARTFEKDGKSDEESARISSRFRAYDRCLEAKSTQKQFVKWFRGKEISRLQKRTQDVALTLVQSAVIDNLPNCRNFYYEFDPDKPQGLKVELEDGRILPFKTLSDGTRNFFAILSDIAYKAVTLNPHLKENALRETEGIVLIDELDLHLHPEWQRRIVGALRSTFPKIQFICSTHSPFIIQTTEPEELLILKDNFIKEINSGINMSIEDIAEMHQDVENPQWSEKRQELYKLAPQYYEGVKKGNLSNEVKEKFEEAVKPFTMDTALFSVLKEEEIIREYLKNKNESN